MKQLISNRKIIASVLIAVILSACGKGDDDKKKSSSSNSYYQQSNYPQYPVNNPNQQWNDVNHAQQNLSSYNGQWVTVNGYSYWQPGSVGNDFQPFSSNSGRWTGEGVWRPNYPFGWYTDFYGLWRYHYSYGWIWQPYPNNVYNTPTVMWYTINGQVTAYPYISPSSYSAYFGFNLGANYGFTDNYWMNQNDWQYQYEYRYRNSGNFRWYTF